HALEELRRLAPRLGTAQWHRDCSADASTAASGSVQPVTAELAAALDDHVFLCFTHTRRGAAAITIADGAASAYDLAPAADIADAVAKLLHAARSAALFPGARGRDTVRPGALVERLLLAPVAAALGTRPLVIAPAPYTRDLPWGMLPGLRGRAVTVVPSGRSWLDCRNRAAGRGRRARRVLLAAGRELAGAAAEVESLRPRYPEATVLTGPAARVPDVLRGLGRADVAHLSAHGSAPADTPMLSGIFLADGPLFAYDLERLPESPALTVLSSCWVGRCAPSPSGFPLGLSTSLLATGGVTVIAGVLPVSDGETTPGMLRLHDALAADVPPARAVADHLADSGFVCFGAG
ncbi:CHAT domain-containing protein, partial [Allosalinactinospora lopnorensis]|uniref:CHAT domain-containing protein n=1 Tax=Allosalinactinospora lopnorensis TaxID=1352348 RepID=UPI0012E1E97D